MTSAPAVYKTDLPNLLARGKVRDIYQLSGDRLMIVATDRISAFDVVMDQPVPGKGILLTQMTRFWLETLPACSPHHLEYIVSDDQVPDEYASYVDQLRQRAIVVKRVEILPVECIVRGYIAGSAWREYQATGGVSGVRLPPGLRQAEKLDQPIFTPSTKARVGHDQPLTFDQACQVVAAFLAGKGRLSTHARELMELVRRRSLEIYSQAARLGQQRGIILADTKFEFGLDGDLLLLADEVLTPDSSRFWRQERYRPGEDQASFDKQLLRDYLESLGWAKQPPPPPLPQEIIVSIQRAYEEVYRRLTGRAASI